MSIHMEKAVTFLYIPCNKIILLSCISLKKWKKVMGKSKRTEYITVCLTVFAVMSTRRLQKLNHMFVISNNTWHKAGILGT